MSYDQQQTRDSSHKEEGYEGYAGHDAGKRDQYHVKHIRGYEAVQ
jgi:hypothetical protein